MTSPEHDRVTEIRDSTGVQVGDHNTQNIIGTYIAQHIVQAPAQLAEPIVTGEVPQRAPALQHRPDLMAILETSGPGVAVVRAVTGMRGVGKTQLAAAYARDRIDARWQLVAWINAVDAGHVLGGLANIAAQVGIGQPGQDLTELGRAVRHWLEADGERCLIVFDSATDLGFLTEFLPAAGQCQVVITSNQQSTAGLGTAVPVDVFTAQEGAEFLARRCGQPAGPEAAKLAAELGFLPLALAQAAAVIAIQRLSYPAYLARLNAVPVQDYVRRAAADPYPHAVAEAIVLALDSAAQTDQTGLTEPVLSLLALLSETGVARALLHAAGQLGVLRQAGRHAASPAAVDEALGHLAEMSLVTFSIDGLTAAAHRLTLRVAREQLTRNGRLAAMTAGGARLLDAVRHALGEPWRNRAAARDIVGHIVALHQHSTFLDDGPDAAHTAITLRLRSWAVYCLNELGDSTPQVVTYGTALST